MSAAARKRWNIAKSKRTSGQFAAFPQACWRHENYARLSPHAKALLHELHGQYRGDNNGDLCAAWGTVKHRGLGSRATVDKARDELERMGWTIQTRQGGKHRANLYALTFLDIDSCGNKLDAGIPVGKRLDYWKLGENMRLSPRLCRESEAL